jgi:phage terminase large subunit GpA-like protein
VTTFGRPIRYGVVMQIVDVSFFKQRLYSRLKLDPPTPEQIADGALYREGFCHFPESVNYGEEHFRQLCSEKLVLLRDKRQIPIGEKWEKIRPRNEALDCANYADGAGWQVGVHKFTERHWRMLEAQLGPQQEGFALKAEVAPPMPHSFETPVAAPALAGSAPAQLTAAAAPPRAPVFRRARRVLRVAGRIAV